MLKSDAKIEEGAGATKPMLAKMVRGKSELLRPLWGQSSKGASEALENINKVRSLKLPERRYLLGRQ